MGGMTGNPYASLSPDAMGQRYALPPGGPGAVLTGGRHKKVRSHPSFLALECTIGDLTSDESDWGYRRSSVEPRLVA